VKKNVNLVGVVLFALWLASFVAGLKTGHGSQTYGFFSGG
jgi:hypothetical protein